MIARSALVWMSIAMAAMAVRPARAQSSAAAATLEFDHGRALMKQKKYAEACAAFAKSQQLDAQNGTLFNLADCDVHVGKVATAWLAYRDLAQRDNNPARRTESDKRAQELEPRLPKLLVKVGGGAPSGLAVTINGKDSTTLVGTATPVDLGDYEVRARAPHREPFETSVTVSDEGRTVIVDVELAAAAAGTDDGGEGDGGSSDGGGGGDRSPGAGGGIAIRRGAGEPTHSTRRRNGAILAIAGGGALAAGAVLGLLASSNYDDAKSLCPNLACATSADKQRGDDLVSSARTDAALSTGFVVAGAATAVIGIYLIATAKPEHAPTATAIVTPLPSGALVGWVARF